MSTHAYTEEQLVEQPAVGLFAELGWETVAAMVEVFGAGGTLGREASGKVVLVSRLRAALERLNASRMGHDALPPEAIGAAVGELTRDRSAMLLAQANREVYLLVKEGIRVGVPDTESSPRTSLGRGNPRYRQRLSAAPQRLRMRRPWSGPEFYFCGRRKTLGCVSSLESSNRKRFA